MARLLPTARRGARGRRDETRRPAAGAADELLLRRIAAGDTSAFDAFYARHARAAFAVASRLLVDRSLAEDAVQEAFLNVWRSAARFDGSRSAPRTWLLTLVHRRAVDLIRRRGATRQELRAELPELPDGPDGHVAAARAMRGFVLALLHELPEPERRLLALAYYGGLTQSEIAQRLCLPLGTVKSRTFLALGRLRELLLAREPAARAGRP